jgi:hypothetical protein
MEIKEWFVDDDSIVVCCCDKSWNSEPQEPWTCTLDSGLEGKETEKSSWWHRVTLF